MIGSIDLERFVGIPYIPQGRSKTGCDCWGLIRIVYLESFGVELPSYAGEYADPPETEERALLISREATASWTPVQAHEIEAGDVMLAWLTDPRVPVHVGVMVDRFRVLHVGSSGLETSRVERIDSTFLSKRIVGFFRYRGQ